MRLRCEIIVKEVMPVARASIAKRLIDGYGLSQTEAAKRMGISQPAISQYQQEIRGMGRESIAENPGFMRIVDDMAKRLAEGSIRAENLEHEMCRFCKLLGK